MRTSVIRLLAALAALAPVAIVGAVGSAAQDARAQEETQDPFPEGTPTGRNIADLPAPSTGRTVNIGRVSGEVLVRFPDQEAEGSQSTPGAPEGFVPLDGSAQIPVGSEIDTRRGVLRLQSGSNRSGSRTQTATFILGRFQLRQSRSSRPITEMVLRGGSFRGCGRATSSRRGAAGANHLRSGRRVRRLWGTGRGRFRTRGRFSSATVRGTKWGVEDFCNGTLTRVARRPRTGRVAVRDHVRRRTVTLTAGRSYFAAKRGAQR